MVCNSHRNSRNSSSYKYFQSKSSWRTKILEKFKIIEAKTKKEHNESYKIRYEVFVQEQGVPKELEIDDYDENSITCLVTLGGTYIATGRVLPLNKVIGKIGRMAIRKNYRRIGVGGLILDFLETKAKENGISEITLHAQNYVRNFYLYNGYKTEGKLFFEAGIEHIKMNKKIIR